MNAILKTRNAERLNAVISIEKTGQVSPETLSLLQTERRHEATIALGFSDEDLKYFCNFYWSNKLPKAEDALEFVHNKWADANAKLARMKTPGYKVTPRLTELEDSRDKLYEDSQSIRLRVERLTFVVDTLDGELKRRAQVREAAMPVVVQATVETPKEEPKREATPTPAPAKKKAAKAQTKPKFSYVPDIEVQGGFEGLKEALAFRETLTK